MPLIDLIFHDDPDEVRNLPLHAFSAAVWFWATGKLTRQNVIDAFQLMTEDEVQLDMLESHYTGLTPGERRSFHSDVEAAGNLAQLKLITKAQYKALLGLT